MLRRLRNNFLALLLALAPAQAQEFQFAHSIGAAGGAVTIAFCTTDNDTANASSYSYTGLSLTNCPEAASRILVATHACSSDTSGTPRSFSSAQINSTTTGAALVSVTVSGQRSSAAIVALAAPTGTTATASITWGGGCGRGGMALYALYGRADKTIFDSVTDANTSASDATGTIDVPANGAAVAFTITEAVTTSTWTGLTENSDFAVESTNNFSSASLDFTAAQTGLTITANHATNAIGAMVAASWGP